MSDDKVLSDVTSVFRDIFLREVVLKPEYTAADVAGWDSFKHIEIIMAIEERFGIKFSTKDLDGMKSVGDLLNQIKAKVAA